MRNNNCNQNIDAYQNGDNDILRVILDSINAEVYVADINTFEILYMNHQIRNSFADDYTGEICYKVFRGESERCPLCTNSQLLSTGVIPSEVISWEGKNPITSNWYINHDRAIKWTDGRIVRIQVAVDISDRKKIEKDLKRSEDRYRTVSELTSDYAYAYRVEEDGNLVREWVTGALTNITGYSADELRARGGWESMIHPDDLPIPFSQMEALLAGKEMTIEYRIVDKNGDIRWTRDYAKPEWSEELGRTTHIYGAIQDISARVKAEKALDEVNNNLEERIEERTHELRVILNAMAGREVRMAELKKVIKRLRAQLAELGITPIADDPLYLDG